MKRTPRWLTLVAAILTPSLTAEAATVIFQPGLVDGKDISLYERTDVEVSTSKTLFAINTGPPGPGLDDFTSLVEFDLSSVPTGTVAEATVWLYENNIPTFSFQHVSPEFPNTILVQPAASAWEEEMVRYSTLPAPVPQYDALQTVDAVSTWFAWDVTETVAAWLSGALANNGLMITSTVEIRNQGLVIGSAFDSSEQSNPPYLEIEVMSVRPGDYNADGTINELDFQKWRSEFGTNSAASDGNGNGIVDAADYTVWRDNLEVMSTTSGHAYAVPEPGTTPHAVAAGCFVAAFQWRGRRRAGMLVAAAVLTMAILAGSAQALTIPYTEEFSADGAGWRNAASNPVTHVASGGISGPADGYISTTQTFTANPTTAQTVFRAQDAFDSSGDAFVGDWLAAGVTNFSFWIRHYASTELSFSTRFATSANSPGANAIASPSLVAQPNTWTRLTIPISTSAIAAEGPPSLFDTVFANLGNIQISARPGSNLSTPLTFDLDHVTIVPEPAGKALAAIGTMLLAGLRHWQRRSRALAATLAIAFATPMVWATESAESAPQFTPLPEPLASFGAATLDGWVYVYGGHVGETHEHSREHVRGTFRRQAFGAGPWEELPAGPALQSPALVAHAGRLYRIGGLSARNSEDETPNLHSVASVDCFDPTMQTWTSMPDLPEPRSSHDAVVLGNRNYVVGGWNHHGDEGEGDWHDTVLMLDLSEDVTEASWKVVAKTPFRRRALALAARGEHLYVIGGMTEDLDFSRRVDIFDTRNGEWSRGPDLFESERNGFGASAFTIDGGLYVSSQSNELLVLSDDGTAWERAAPLQVPRFFHRLIPGPRGSVLLIGGANEIDGHLASIACITPRNP